MRIHTFLMGIWRPGLLFMIPVTIDLMVGFPFPLHTKSKHGFFMWALSSHGGIDNESPAFESLSWIMSLTFTKQNNKNTNIKDPKSWAIVEPFFLCARRAFFLKRAPNCWLNKCIPVRNRTDTSAMALGVLSCFTIRFLQN